MTISHEKELTEILATQHFPPVSLMLTPYDLTPAGIVKVLNHGWDSSDETDEVLYFENFAEFLQETTYPPEEFYEDVKHPMFTPENHQKHLPFVAAAPMDTLCVAYVVPDTEMQHILADLKKFM